MFRRKVRPNDPVRSLCAKRTASTDVSPLAVRITVMPRRGKGNVPVARCGRAYHVPRLWRKSSTLTGATRRVPPMFTVDNVPQEQRCERRGAPSQFF